MIKVYGMARSGNCWKAAQILRLTGHAFDWVETDSAAILTAEFEALNPQGEVPVVVLGDGTVLVQSNAILAHFAAGTSWLPPAGLAQTRVLQWLFWEQYSHEPYVAVARNLIHLGQRHAQAERLRLCAERGRKALELMERRLSAHHWLTDAGPTIADLALFAYTQVAEEGEFDLAALAGLRAWRQRLAALPGIEGLPEPDIGHPAGSLQAGHAAGSAMFSPQRLPSSFTRVELRRGQVQRPQWRAKGADK